MALVPVLESLDGIDEEEHKYYSQADDGRFVLQLSGRPRGFVPEGEHRQFRDNNTSLKTQLDEMQGRLTAFDGIDPGKARDLLGAQEELDRKNLLKKGDVEGLIQTELKKGLGPIQAENKALVGENSELKQQLASKVVDAEVLRAGNVFGKMKAGTEDVLIDKAKRSGFQDVDGELRQVVNGNTVYSTETPGQPRSVDEWIKHEAGKEFSWIWEPSVGGGGDGDKGQTTPGGVKEISRGDRDAFRKNLAEIAKGTIKVAGP